MKWLGIKGDHIVATVYAPDKATAERTLGFHTRTQTVFHVDAVMSSASYEVWREEQAALRRHRTPPVDWKKIK